MVVLLFRLDLVLHWSVRKYELYVFWGNSLVSIEVVPVVIIGEGSYIWNAIEKCSSMSEQ